MGGILALRSCGFPWCPPCPTVMLCEERPRCTHLGLGCTHLPIAKTRQPHPCSPGEPGKDQPALCPQGSAGVAQVLAMCQALGSPRLSPMALSSAQHTDPRPNPDPKFTLTPGSL